MSQYSCSETNCSASGMNAAELAEHAVTAHGDTETKVTLVDDVTHRPKLFGRKPKN